MTSIEIPEEVFSVRLWPDLETVGDTWTGRVEMWGNLVFETSLEDDGNIYSMESRLKRMFTEKLRKLLKEE